MADGTFATVAGFIQFPVEEREVNNGTVRDATIRSIVSGELVRITIWPDFADTEVAEGDFIAVDGKASTRSVGEKTYNNMSARKLAVTPGVAPAEREVVKKERVF